MKTIIHTVRGYDEALDEAVAMECFTEDYENSEYTRGAVDVIAWTFTRGEIETMRARTAHIHADGKARTKVLRRGQRIMTIAEAIATLEKVPADRRHLPLYVWDNDHLRITGITPFDTAQPHNKDNPLGIDLENEDTN